MKYVRTRIFIQGSSRVFDLVCDNYVMIPYQDSIPSDEHILIDLVKGPTAMYIKGGIISYHLTRNILPGDVVGIERQGNFTYYLIDHDLDNDEVVFLKLKDNFEKINTIKNPCSIELPKPVLLSDVIEEPKPFPTLGEFIEELIVSKGVGTLNKKFMIHPIKGDEINVQPMTVNDEDYLFIGIPKALIMD